ncbi:single-stranded DNA-binding protein [candidate division KSB1 bacterium]|nr:MAG: single-stranded DNA-binding protein [candidate division KSB1 bacterium]
MSRGTVNKAIIVGRVGKDPEVRYTPGGTSVANISVATNYRAKDADGNWADNTEWHNVVVFGQLADFAGNYVKKGRLVYVEGRLQTRNWEDQNNVKHYRTEIIANTLQLLGSRQDNADTESTETVTPTESSATPANNKVEEPPVDAPTDEDDLPF